MIYDYFCVEVFQALCSFPILVDKACKFPRRLSHLQSKQTNNYKVSSIEKKQF